MREETVSERIAEDVAALRKEVFELHALVGQLREALVGTLGQPGGLVIATQQNQRDLERLRAEFNDHVLARQRMADAYEARVSALEDWRLSLANRAIGIAIGVALVAAAGGGAGGIIAAVIGQLVLP